MLLYVLIRNGDSFKTKVSTQAVVNGKCIVEKIVRIFNLTHRSFSYPTDVSGTYSEEKQSMLMYTQTLEKILLEEKKRLS